MSIAAKVGTLPVGAVIDYPWGATPPTGWLKCDGSVLSQATYPTLFGIVGHRPTLQSVSLTNAANPTSSNPIFETNGRLVHKRSNNTGLPDEWTWSADGISWTTFGTTGTTAGANGVSSVLWDGTRWIFTRPDSASTTQRIYYSTNGATWTAGANFTTTGSAVQCGICGNGTVGYVWIEPNTTNSWTCAAGNPTAVTARTLSANAPNFTSMLESSRRMVAASHGLYVVAGNTIARFATGGGTVATAKTMTTSSSPRIFEANNTLAAVDGAAGTNVATTTDGVTWTDRSAFGARMLQSDFDTVCSFGFDGTNYWLGFTSFLWRSTGADLSTFVAWVATLGGGASPSYASAIVLSRVAMPSMGTYGGVGQGGNSAANVIGSSSKPGAIVSANMVCFEFDDPSGTNGIALSLDKGATFTVTPYGFLFNTSGFTFSGPANGRTVNDSLFIMGSSQMLRTTLPYTLGTQFQLPMQYRPHVEGMGKIIKAI